MNSNDVIIPDSPLQTYDAGSYFTLARSEDGDLRVFVTSEEGIETSNPNW